MNATGDQLGLSAEVVFWGADDGVFRGREIRVGMLGEQTEANMFTSENVEQRELKASERSIRTSNLDQRTAGKNSLHMPKIAPFARRQMIPSANINTLLRTTARTSIADHLRQRTDMSGPFRLRNNPQ